MSPLTLAGLQKLNQKLAIQSPVSSAKVVSIFGARDTVDGSPSDIAKIKSALTFLSPDAPRGTGSIMGPDGTFLDDNWFGIILAVRRALGDESGYPVAKQWSEHSQRYTDEGFEAAWRAYDPSHPNPVTIGSVFALARHNGWTDDTPSPSYPAPCASRFALLDRDAIMAIPCMDWRVKGIFPTRGLAVIYGASGSGKSFLAIDLAISIAEGRPWSGLKTKACHSTYVMLEGEAGLSNRVKAWEQFYSRPIPADFYAITQPFDFNRAQDVEDLGACLPKFGVAIIDTFNRAAPGIDENASKDMGNVITGMKRLQAVTEGLVIVVHHTGKEASRGMRGHSSLHAALDAAIEVQRAETGRQWKAAKVKDGDDTRATSFELHAVHIGFDADGEVVTSCVAEPADEKVSRPQEPTAPQQKQALSIIKLKLEESPDSGQAGSSPGSQCIKFDDAIEHLLPMLNHRPKNKQRNVAKTIVGKLIGGGYLNSAEDTHSVIWLWI